MNFQFSNYHIKITEKPYQRADGTVFNQTAIITFINKLNEPIESFNYGVIEIKALYDQIENQEEINLDNCFIRNFSLNTFRRLRILDKKEYIKIKKFSAINAFFESTHEIDFSYAEFENGDINFPNTIFAKGNVCFNHSKFADGNKNFSQAVFHKGNFEFSNCELTSGEVNFKDCIFKIGKKDFQYTNFGSSSVIFTDCEFNEGDFIFVNTQFTNGNLNFKVARFGECRADFRYGEYKKTSILFDQTEFGHGRKDFKTCEFINCKVNFNRSTFNDGDVFFDGCELVNSRLTFKRTFFGNGKKNFEILEGKNSEISFDKAFLNKGSINFNNSQIKKLSFKSCHLDDYLNLRLMECEAIDLSDTIVRDIIDLRPYENDVKINIINFVNLRLLGRIYVDWNENNVFELISKQECSNQDKAEQFLILKENFNTCGQYDFEDSSYVHYKRFELEAKLEKSVKEHKISALWQYPWYALKKLIFDHMGLYATAPLRVLLSMLVTYVIFAIAFAIVLFAHSDSGIISGIGGKHAELSLIGRSLYHSAITFLTIGYGDFYPMGIIRWLSGIEGFIGLFLMSYFTVAFVRKILR